MMKLLKELPDFKTEDEEFEFWKTHDSSEYMDWKNAKRIVFPNLRSAEGVIEIAVDPEELRQLKALADASATSPAAIAEDLIHEALKRRIAA